MDLRDVPADAQRARYDFLIADFLATRAEAELAAGKPDAAHRVLERAKAGYSIIRRLSPKLEDPGERNEIEAKLSQLRARLDSLGQKMYR